MLTETVGKNQRFVPYNSVYYQALSAAAGPLVRTYPERTLDLLNLLLPGIDVNDIWKCTDIFVLMSDLLEMIPIADLSAITDRTGSF